MEILLWGLYLSGMPVFIVASYWAASHKHVAGAETTRQLSWVLVPVWPLFVAWRLSHNLLIKLFGKNKYD